MIAVVVPTLGRATLDPLLATLDAQRAELPDVEVIVVDDRLTGHGPPLPVRPHTTVLRSGGIGPAAARNLGWRYTDRPWVAFLDDDVLPDPDWLRTLAADLTTDPEVGGVQGRVRVPLPAHRPPTDWERHTAGLAGSRWITADMAYRRAALVAASGFDERFPRAYREDADLAHRVRGAGWQLALGKRTVSHPVRPAGPWASVRTQRGNADDALLRRLYGPRWRSTLDIPTGRRRRHLLVTAAGAAALAASVVPLPRRVRRTSTAVATAVWLAGTTELAWRRIAPGPRTPAEVTTMVITSVLIPPVAIGHWLRGWWSTRGTDPQ